MNRARASALLLPAVLLSASCFSDSAEEILDPGGIQPTLSSIQENVFTPTCAISGCHAPPAQHDLDLTDGEAYANLVEVPSEEQPGVDRVAPGEPLASYLYRKLLGDPSITGERMPYGGPPLPSHEIEAIREWIENGALDN